MGGYRRRVHRAILVYGGLINTVSVMLRDAFLLLTRLDGDRIKHEPIDHSIRPSDPRRSGAAVKHDFDPSLQGVDGLGNSGPDGTRSRSGRLRLV